MAKIIDTVTDNSSQCSASSARNTFQRFSLAFDWLRKWPEFSRPTMVRSKAKLSQSQIESCSSRNTLSIHNKTALIREILPHVLCFSIVISISEYLNLAACDIHIQTLYEPSLVVHFL